MGNMSDLCKLKPYVDGRGDGRGYGDGDGSSYGSGEG